MNVQDSALIVVDMLYDFIDGSLACLNSENAVDNTVRFIRDAMNCEEGEECEILDSFPILFVCDHHPADHSSFKEFGGIWPPHCVQGTRGGEIHDNLKPFVKDGLQFFKGCDRDKEQYSGYESMNSAGQSLCEVLSMLDIKKTYICGIATEYCVLNTVNDLVKGGFEPIVLTDALAYVGEEGHRKALEEMKSKNIQLI